MGYLVLAGLAVAAYVYREEIKDWFSKMVGDDND